MRHNKRFATFALVALASAALLAGNAHFVGVPNITETDDTLFISGKVAGLGNIPQIHVVVTADCECVNPGNKKPSADNKDSFAVEGDFPVQNGKANFSLILNAAFTPDCLPPMTADWSNILITVTADDGTFVTYP
jgi:hypothetical protein